MKTSIAVDKSLTVSVESRATGKVKVSIDYSFMGMAPQVSISPDQAFQFAEALRLAAVAARGEARKLA